MSPLDGDLHVHEVSHLHGLTVVKVCLGSEVCMWASQEFSNETLQNEVYSPKKQVISHRRKRRKQIVRIFAQLNRAHSQERLFDQENQVALNKNFVRCCNSSLQLLHSNCILSSVITMGHSVRKYRKKMS